MKHFRIVLMLLFFIVLAYLITPSLIKLKLKSSTEQLEIIDNKAKFAQLTDKIYFVNSTPKLIRERDSLYLWFYLRSIEIDDGHSPKTVQQDWDAILDFYFRNE